MIDAVFWVFMKRINSTRQPPTSGGTTVKFSYKEGSDRHNPTIILSEWTDTWSYAMIEGVYMYVEYCIAIANKLFEVKLRIDSMATYKAYIQATSAYVSYGTENTSDYIADTRFPLDVRNNVSASTVQFPLLAYGNKSLILTTVGASGVPDIYGGFAVSHYITPERCRDLVQLLLYADQDILNQMARIFKSPYDSILSLRVVCANIGAALGDPEDIWLGQYNTGVEGFRIAERIIEGDITIPINWQENDWKAASPFCDLEIFIPAYGKFTVNAGDCYQTSAFILHYCLDVVTGDIAYKLTTSADHSYMTIGTFQSNLGVEVPIAQQSGGNVASGILGTLFHGATGALNGMLQTKTTASGSIGSVAGVSLSNTIQVITNIKKPMDYNPGSIIGKPVGKVVQLESGYVECVGASVRAPAWYGEIQEINSYLNGGAYIE